MGKIILAVSNVFICILVFGAAFAHADTQCTYLTNDKTYGYCVTKTPGSKNPDFLYYMHGASQNQHSWVDSKKLVYGYWTDHHIDAPTVITMSFGPIWLLAQKNKAAASGLLEYVTDTYMPQIEASLGGLHGRRLVFGESMGGFNAAQLIMKKPELFAKAVITCPDITTLMPYSSVDDMKAWSKATGADFWHAAWETVMQRIFFADNDAWNQASVLVIDKQYLGPKTPPLFLSCGEQDEFGFFPGAQAFAAQAKASGVNIIWEPLQGKHCTYDIEGSAAFLVTP